MKCPAFIKNHPLLTYFLLTFIISWGGVMILGAPYGMPTAQETFKSMWPIVFLPYLLGPLISSMLLTGFIYGKTGYRNIASRLLNWPIGLKWYAVALLTAPLIILAILIPLSRLSSVFTPALFTTNEIAATLLMGIAVGLFGGGLMEEPGWTGFAVPHFRKKYGIFSTGLILGIVWGIWHLLPTYWGSGNATGIFDPMLFLPPCIFYIGVLPAYRVLMVWVFENTSNLLVAILMHMSITASSLFILPPSATGISLAIYYLILTGVMWAVDMLMMRTGIEMWKTDGGHK